MEVMTIDSELRVSQATAWLARYFHPQPSDYVFYEDSFWLDLGLTPRPQNARACYLDGWAPHRFERLGAVFVVPPRHAFRFKTDGGGMASLTCQIRPETLRKWSEDEFEWTDRQLEATLNISNTEVRRPLVRLAQELRDPGLASYALVELLIGQTAIELCRYFAGVRRAAAQGGLATWRLRIIDERLTEVREPATLDELASLCNLSVRQLARGFRASRNCTIGDYVVQKRAELAKRLLGTDESIKAIAHSLGFASHSSFTFAFRRTTGMTPREFRQRVLGART